MTELKRQRNEIIRQEFYERFTVNEWNKVKVSYLYYEIGKKYFLSADSIRKIVSVHTKK